MGAGDFSLPGYGTPTGYLDPKTRKGRKNYKISDSGSSLKAQGYKYLLLIERQSTDGGFTVFKHVTKAFDEYGPLDLAGLDGGGAQCEIRPNSLGGGLFWYNGRQTAQFNNWGGVGDAIGCPTKSAAIRNAGSIDNYGLGVDTSLPRGGRVSTWISYCPDGMGPDPVFGTVFGPGNDPSTNGMSERPDIGGHFITDRPSAVEKWGSFTRIKTRRHSSGQRFQFRDARYARTFMFGGCTSEKLRQFGTRWFLYASKVPFGDNLPPLP